MLTGATGVVRHAKVSTSQSRAFSRLPVSLARVRASVLAKATQVPRKLGGQSTLVPSRSNIGKTTARLWQRMMATHATSNGAKGAEKDLNLLALRKIMEEKNLDAFVIPTADPHQSEYPPHCFARREFITGFTGSAGTAVVTKKNACLWTDGRYFLQAADELGPEWTLQKAGLPKTPKMSDWLKDNLEQGMRVGLDPFVHAANEVKELNSTLSKGGLELVLEPDNPVDEAWVDRPAFPTADVRIHPETWAGSPVPEKLKMVREEMDKHGGEALLVSKLDDVAWLLNLRGGDIESNPVFVAYAIVEKDSVRLFVDGSKITDVVATHLAPNNVHIYRYDQVVEGVKEVVKSGKKVMFDPVGTSVALEQAAKAGSFVEAPSPFDLGKAIKNDRELEGMKEAHLRDGAALAKFWSWMDVLTKNGETVDEYVAGGELANFRAEQVGFIEPSFPSIVGEGPHGAVIHYRASKQSARDIKAGSILLVDSGGQYDCGTTDVTRVYMFGGDEYKPTDFQKEVYTRVLKGHIALDQTIWPENTPGHVLDAYARRPLWEIGLNYMHGTGHGVGAALNVHEGPHSISPRYTNQVALQEGMICSNEPAFYEDGSFGVRIENLLYVTPKETKHNFNDVKYLGFEKLTYVPIQQKMVNIDLLTDDEIEWLNTYHQEVWEKISPRLTDEPVALDWLFEHTQPISRGDSGEENTASASGVRVGAPSAAEAVASTTQSK